MAGFNLDQITKVETVNVPVGMGASMLLGIGTADAIEATLSKMTNIQAVWWGVILAFGLPNVPFVRNTLGRLTTEVMSAAILASAINDYYDIEKKVADFWTGIFGQGEVVGGSPGGKPPVLASKNPAPAPLRDYYAGAGF